MKEPFPHKEHKGLKNREIFSGENWAMSPMPASQCSQMGMVSAPLIIETAFIEALRKKELKGQKKMDKTDMMSRVDRKKFSMPKSWRNRAVFPSAKRPVKDSVRCVVGYLIEGVDKDEDFIADHDKQVGPPKVSFPLSLSAAEMIRREVMLTAFPQLIMLMAFRR